MKLEELVEFMNFHGISGIELSEILGVSTQAVNLWLTNQRELSTTNTRLIRLLRKYPKLIREF